MKKTLILVAGPPATGKSYLIAEIRKIIPDFFLISPDEIKELYAEKYGFNNLIEKATLEESVWAFYYHIIDEYMDIGKKLIITEYPFSQKQKGKFEELTHKYQYQTITIRLVCDFNTLWQRRQKRDIEQSRHLSHIMSHYHLGDILEDRTLADNHITEEGFKERILKNQYNTFSMGELYEIDVTDYSQLNYTQLIHDIEQKIIT